MFLFLVQHGLAKDKSEDPDRPLSDKGREEVERILKFFAKSSLQVKNIFHSGKTRAKQTAEMLNRAFKVKDGVETSPDLNPLDPANLWVKKLDDYQENIMLVGHLPHLSVLASLLLGSDEDNTPVCFRQGGVVCLKKTETSKWSLVWMVTPDIID
ncbi:phosphohistidine phosphatase SixA [Candidatus Riflebacteria bacterium]